MDARLQRRVQRYGWDRAAAKYEQYWTTQLHPAQTRLLEMAALTPGEGVLDVACGTGLVTFPAAHAVGSTGTVLGIDISDGMVDRLRFSATTLGLTQVTAARMDAERLTLPDDTFDVALNALGLMYVSDPVMSLREVWHVLRPGGRGVAAVWGMRKLCGWAEIFPIVDRRVESEVCPLFFQLGTGDALRHAFEAAGFADIVVERITTTLEYATGDDACAAAFVGGPVALAYSRFDSTTRTEVHAEYLASIDQYRHEGTYALPGEFVIALGVKP